MRMGAPWSRIDAANGCHSTKIISYERSYHDNFAGTFPPAPDHRPGTLCLQPDRFFVAGLHRLVEWRSAQYDRARGRCGPQPVRAVLLHSCAPDFRTTRAIFECDYGGFSLAPHLAACYRRTLYLVCDRTPLCRPHEQALGATASVLLDRRRAPRLRCLVTPDTQSRNVYFSWHAAAARL